MSNVNNFSLIGVGSNVQYGKGNGFITYSGGAFAVRQSDDSTLTTLSIADATQGTHAVAYEQLANNHYVNTAGSGVSISGQTLSLNLGTNAGLVDTGGPLNINLASNSGLLLSSNTLSLDIATLGTAGAVNGTNLVAISQGGATVSTTVSSLVDAVITLQPSVATATIVADGVHSTFNVGYPLPNLSGLTTYISRATLNVTTPFTGGSVANATLTDGTNSVMEISEENISTVATYVSDLAFTFSSNGSQCIINFLRADGTTAAIPTAGTANIAIEFTESGFSGTGGGGGGGSGISQIVAGAQLTGGTITTSGTISLGTTSVTAGTYGNGSNVAQIIVNAYGQITSATNIGISGGGNVTGPLVSTNNAIATYNGTTGTLIQNTNASVDSSGNITANGLTISSVSTQLSRQAILYNTTTNNSSTQLFLDGVSQQLVLPNNATWIVEVKIAARRTDAASESDVFWFDGAIDRQANAASTAMVGTRDITQIEQQTNWSVSVTNDATNGALNVSVIGENSKTIRWTAFVNIIEALN